MGVVGADVLGGPQSESNENLVFPRLRCARRSHPTIIATFTCVNHPPSFPFNQLMRNFKRNSSCYEQQWRNFDRIELNSRSAKRGDRPRRGALQNENSKAPRRSRADSVETSRTSKTSAFNRVLTHTYARSLKNIFGRAQNRSRLSVRAPLVADRFATPSAGEGPGLRPIHKSSLLRQVAYATEMTRCHIRLKVAFSFQLISA